MALTPEDRAKFRRWLDWNINDALKGYWDGRIEQHQRDKAKARADAFRHVRSMLDRFNKLKVNPKKAK